MVRFQRGERCFWFIIAMEMLTLEAFERCPVLVKRKIIYIYIIYIYNIYNIYILYIYPFHMYLKKGMDVLFRW